MATTYQTPNGVKPRFDNGGTEFGRMHRDLGKGYLMLDIDRLSVSLEMKREEECFIEFRTSYSSRVIFISIIELKKSYTEYSKKALDMSEANSIAREEIRRRLSLDQSQPCRLFVVFATDGTQPFEFYECIDNEFLFIGTLDYTRDDREQKVKSFWSDVLKINK